jgi:hypothetical protein
LSPRNDASRACTHITTGIAADRPHLDQPFRHMHPVALRIDADCEGGALDDGCQERCLDAEMLLSLSVDLEQSRPEVLKDASHATLLFGQSRAAIRPDHDALIAIGNDGPTISAGRYARPDGEHLTCNARRDGACRYGNPDPAADFTQPPVGSPGRCWAENQKYGQCDHD